MKELQFRLRNYNDVYNVELQKRFHNCYRIDLLSNNHIISSLITDNKSGTIFHTELSKRLTISKSNLSLSRYSEQLWIESELFCSREKHQRSFFNRRGINSWLEFNDGQILSSDADNMSYWKAPGIIDYFQNDQLVCQLKVCKPGKNFRELFSQLDYIGNLTYSENLNPEHLLVIFQFLIIDHIYSINSSF